MFDYDYSYRLEEEDAKAERALDDWVWHEAWDIADCFGPTRRLIKAFNNASRWVALSLFEFGDLETGELITIKPLSDIGKGVSNALKLSNEQAGQQHRLPAQLHHLPLSQLPAIRLGRTAGEKAV